MESNQLNNSNEEAVIELLTLTCEIDEDEKVYRNKEGQVHRIHGPAMIYKNETEFWCRNNRIHREDGPAVIHADGDQEWWINDKQLSKEKFILWQIKNGINPIE